ncbi:hypothetical protein JCM5296_003613 [Sporobolomyces johnsonii]
MDSAGGRGSELIATFGGIQLVVTGDFFQLPPVTEGVTPTFAFEAEAMEVMLSTTRSTSRRSSVKRTPLSPESIKKFSSWREPAYNGLKPTELFPMRHQVEHANQNRLEALQGDAVTFKADDWALNKNASQMKNDPYLRNFKAPETLVLKPGARVMLIKNLDPTLVNGTVVGFSVPELEDDEDDGGGMIVGGATVKCEMSTAEVRKKQKIAQAVAQGKLELGPMVEWRTPTGIESKIVVREELKVEDNKGSKLRTGGSIRSFWQSYVALSRATSLDGLQVVNFNPKNVLAHEKVIEWSRSLQVLS